MLAFTRRPELMGQGRTPKRTRPHHGSSAHSPGEPTLPARDARAGAPARGGAAARLPDRRHRFRGPGGAQAAPGGGLGGGGDRPAHVRGHGGARGDPGRGRHQRGRVAPLVRGMHCGDPPGRDHPRVAGPGGHVRPGPPPGDRTGRRRLQGARDLEGSAHVGAGGAQRCAHRLPAHQVGRRGGRPRLRPRLDDPPPVGHLRSGRRLHHQPGRAAQARAVLSGVR